MAIWQVACVLINKDRTLRYDDSRFLCSLCEIERFFPEEKSWCESIKQYGSLDSTCIEFYLSNNDIIDGIDLRLDLRSIKRKHMEIICKFANKNDLFIMYEKSLYVPNLDNLVAIINESNAYKFLSNAKEFLEKIQSANTGDG